MAESLEHLGKTANVDKLYNEAYQIGKCVWMLPKLSQLALKRGDTKAALKFADLAIANLPDEGHLQKAQIYVQLNQPQSAITEYSALIPNASKKFTELKTGSSETIKASRFLRRALDGRAACYDQLGKHDLAERDRAYHKRMDREVFEASPFAK